MSLPREWCNQESIGAFNTGTFRKEIDQQQVIGGSDGGGSGTIKKSPTTIPLFGANTGQYTDDDKSLITDFIGAGSCGVNIGAGIGPIGGYIGHGGGGGGIGGDGVYSGGGGIGSIGGGSLFSIHSAPPAPAAINVPDPIGPNSMLLQQHEIGLQFVAKSELQRQRPMSLAVESICTKKVHQHTSENEEEDNENLLTVSSLTARPLIAKSRELRSSRTDNTGKGSLAEPPDGGFGWIVVLGAFCVQFWVAGLVKSYGVLYVEIMETFPSASAALASWIPAILSALCLVLAPLSSALCQRFSCRIVVFFGGCFCALGLTLSYFATNLIHLLFTFGILTGIGGGLSTTPGIIIVSQYFDRHRALANGICVSGTAAGSFVFPMLIERLVRSFGFHGTILILGGCMLNVCISAMVYRPLDEKTGKNNGGNDRQQQQHQQQQQQNQQNTTQQSSLTIKDHLTTTHSSQNDICNFNGSEMNTNCTYLMSNSSEEPLNSKYIESIFFKGSNIKNDDFYSVQKFIKVTDKNLQHDSDDEDKDVIGETPFMKPIKTVRSSGILHSVEDLSTDSTFVYKSRGSFNESMRGSGRRKDKNAFSADEMLSKIPPNECEVLKMPAKRGLSKSMIIPTPVSDFSKFDCEPGDKHSNSCFKRLNRYLDITLLKDGMFILMCSSVTLVSTGCPYMLYYLPASVVSAGYTKSEAGYLVAVSASLDLFGRLGIGWFSDLHLFDRKKAYIVCIFGAGIAVLIIPLAQSWYLLLGCSAGMYGLFVGCWYVLVPVLLADLFGTDRISSSYGLVRMFQSVGAISVPPLAGYSRDLSGGYEICFFCMGTCMVIGALPMIVSIVFCDLKKNNEENVSNNSS